jgi:quercetin dioxygenase-like cupin family protein
MTITRGVDAPRVETPNAVMTTLASPAKQGSDLAVWTVSMRPGQVGPTHAVDADQVYVVTGGRLRLTIEERPHVLETGDAVHLAAGTWREVAVDGQAVATALVAMPAGGRVTLPDGTERGVAPWAE